MKQMHKTSSQVGKTTSRSITLAKMAKFLLKLALIAVVFVLGCSAGLLAGGLGEEKPVLSNDTEINQLVQAVKSDVYKKLPSSANATLTPISYRSQVVSGTVYFVKVDIGKGMCAVLKINQSLSQTLSLMDAKQWKCADNISFF